MDVTWPDDTLALAASVDRRDLRELGSVTWPPTHSVVRREARRRLDYAAHDACSRRWSVSERADSQSTSSIKPCVRHLHSIDKRRTDNQQRSAR